MVWVTAVDTMLATLVLVNDTTMTCGIHRHVHTRAAVHPHLGVALHRQGIRDPRLRGYTSMRYEARLNAWGIMTPLGFLRAPLWQLHKQVFRSVVGYYWYLRLRGYEIDTAVFGRKSYGQSYSLHHFTADSRELRRLLMKLCEKMGRRLRHSGHFAQGVHVFCGFREHGGWHLGRTFPGRVLYATQDLYQVTAELLEQRPAGRKVAHLAVSCYGLVPIELMPAALFETPEAERIRLAGYLDRINDRYGEYVIHPASMMGLEKEVIKRVPFHATRDTLSEIYRA